MESIIINIAVLFVGLCLGSFLSVVIYRILHHQKGIIAGRSRCPNCRHQLGALDLIPVLSWLFQKGRCNYCQKPISAIYPALELSSGLLLLSTWLSFQVPLFELNTIFSNLISTNVLNWSTLIYLEIINLILLSICFYDLQTKKIPNLFLIVWVVASIPALITQSWISALIAIIINLVFFGGQWFISKERWLGLGDVYFSIGMAFLLGWEKNLLAIVCSYFLGSIIAIILLLKHKANSKTPLPFTPFLIMGTLIAIYFGKDIILWYTSFSF